jgi:hypothetical protein
MIVLTFINIVFIGSDHEGINESIKNFLQNSTYFFITLFHIEFIVKITGYGLEYFENKWNRIDFGILVLTDVLYIILP